MLVESLSSLLLYLLHTKADRISGMTTDVIICCWHVTTWRATSDSLLMASYKEALMINVLFLLLQYSTVRPKHRSEKIGVSSNKRRRFKSTMQERSQKALARVSKAKCIYIHWALLGECFRPILIQPARLRVRSSRTSYGMFFFGRRCFRHMISTYA